MGRNARLKAERRKDRRPRGHRNYPIHDCVKESGVRYEPDERLGVLDTEIRPDNFRERWPRKMCPVCGAICYASFEHYIAGNW